MCEEIKNYLERISKSFDRYFGTELKTSEELRINQNSFSFNYIPDDELLNDKLIKLCTNYFLKMQFET